jgi:hypothetical protein
MRYAIYLDQVYAAAKKLMCAGVVGRMHLINRPGSLDRIGISAAKHVIFPVNDFTPKIERINQSSNFQSRNIQGTNPPSSSLVISFPRVEYLKDASIGSRGRSRRVRPSRAISKPNLTFHPSVTDLRPNDTAEDPFLYTFKVQCTSCREIHPNWVSVNRFVSLSGHGS